MSTVLTSGANAYTAPLTAPTTAKPAIVLVGTGTVGAALVARWSRLQERRIALPPLRSITNSRNFESCASNPIAALRRVQSSARQRDYSRVDVSAVARGDIIIDATANDVVAARHGDWLAHGMHVVTANKLGCGASLTRARAIASAMRAGRTLYGDSATVGAGLPVLRAIRELIAGGDRIHSIEGVLSGSLAWLLDRYDGMRPFSGFVREAHAAGYTEPDPRIDLSGEDVRRKVLILARAAGIQLCAERVSVASLVSPILASLPRDLADAQLTTLDLPMRKRFQAAYRAKAKLQFVGGFAVGADGRCNATVGLRSLVADHPLYGGHNTDNRIAIYSDRYRQQPLVIQGPGAGAEVTAAALLDDIVRISNQSHR